VGWTEEVSCHGGRGGVWNDERSPKAQGDVVVE